MTSSSVDRRLSSSTTVVWPTVALLLAVGCSGEGIGGPGVGSGSGGAADTGGATANGGTIGTGDTTASGGTTGTGGTTGKGGTTGLGGVSSSGGNSGSGATTANGGALGGGSGKGGTTGTGDAGKGGTTGTGGVTGSGGASGRAGASGNDGGVGTGGAAVDGGTSSVDCSATMPTAGGKTYTGKNVYGTANGLNYGIWTNGDGGSITVFPDAHAFSTSWSESKDFLAHLGLDFNGSKSYADYGTITAEFAESKTGTAGSFSMIGMYGWMHNPCIEWYINEDSFNGLYGRGSVTATIDGSTYYLSTTTTTGTGGANACESGHTGPWTQMISTRKTARQCGTVTVSDHFAAWVKQGWTLGNLTSVHINVEVGGGTGSVQFPVANVTTTSK